MIEYNTSLPKLYRCKIEPTGEFLTRLNPFTIPMIPTETITYTKEREMAILMPESSLREFLGDFESWLEVIALSKENPMIHDEYKKLLVLTGLLK